MTDFPSVTTVLKPYMDFSMVPPEVLEAACARGTEVHDLCAAHALNLWVSEIPGRAAGFHQSFVRWFDSYVAEVHLVEERIVHEALGYHGQLDLLITIKGDHGPSLWDLKTGAGLLPWWSLQVAAYDALARLQGFNPIRRGSIRLDRQGKRPKLTEYTGFMERDFSIFMSALNVWRFFNEG